MAKAEWGTSERLSCGARFYDLRREPIVCPACGAAVDAARSKPRRARPAPAPAKVVAVAAAAAAEAELELVVVEDDTELDTNLEEVEEEAL